MTGELIRTIRHGEKKIIWADDTPKKEPFMPDVTKELETLEQGIDAWVEAGCPWDFEAQIRLPNGTPRRNPYMSLLVIEYRKYSPSAKLQGMNVDQEFQAYLDKQHPCRADEGWHRGPFEEFWTVPNYAESQVDRETGIYVSDYDDAKIEWDGAEHNMMYCIARGCESDGFEIKAEARDGENVERVQFTPSTVAK